MAEMAKYIYGIINSAKDELFGPYGITACEEVYTIPYQDAAAVVSDSEMVDPSHILKDAMARLLVRHQKVIEKVMEQGYSIIPVRLGTFAVDEAEVRQILAKGHSLAREIFNKISGKIEVDVVATWNNFDLVLKEVGQESQIREFKQRFLANPNGVTVDNQMKAGVMVKKALDKRRRECATRIQDVLKGVCQDLKAHDLMDDRMVMNTAFLMEKTRREDFDKRVEELNFNFNESLNFRCVGPLPPYSFYTLQIEKMEFGEVDRARKKLSLKNSTTKDEVHKVYQRLALFCHPDKNPGMPGIEKEFEEVARAYKLLEGYCLACEQAGQDQTCSFDEEVFKKNAILVKVKE